VRPRVEPQRRDVPGPGRGRRLDRADRRRRGLAAPPPPGSRRARWSTTAARCSSPPRRRRWSRGAHAMSCAPRWSTAPRSRRAGPARRRSRRAVVPRRRLRRSRRAHRGLRRRRSAAAACAAWSTPRSRRSPATAPRRGRDHDRGPVTADVVVAAGGAWSGRSGALVGAAHRLHAAQAPPVRAAARPRRGADRVERRRPRRVVRAPRRGRRAGQRLRPHDQRARRRRGRSAVRARCRPLAGEHLAGLAIARAWACQRTYADGGVPRDRLGSRRCRGGAGSPGSAATG
jgi:hypothetical protein